jgi:hypothetical protein
MHVHLTSCVKTVPELASRYRQFTHPGGFSAPSIEKQGYLGTYGTYPALDIIASKSQDIAHRVTCQMQVKDEKVSGGDWEGT